MDVVAREVELLQARAGSSDLRRHTVDFVAAKVERDNVSCDGNVGKSVQAGLREVEVVLVLLAPVRTVTELGVFKDGLCSLFDGLCELVVGLNGYLVFLTLEFIFYLLIVRLF